MTRSSKKILFSFLAVGFVASCIAVGFVVSRSVATAAKKEARVTQIIRDVKILSSDAAARPAAVNDTVKEDTGVRTGGESRSELTFADLTIARLGADTVFSFNEAGRAAQLDGGSVLLRVPKNSGGAIIRAKAVTVAVTGTTVIFESDRTGKSKLIVLEGGARLSLVAPPGQSREVRAGQALDVPAGASSLPKSTNIDLAQLMKTNPLIVGFAPLPSRDLITAAALATETERLKGERAELNAAADAKRLADTQARAAADAAALAKLKAAAKTNATNTANAKAAAQKTKANAARPRTAADARGTRTSSTIKRTPVDYGEDEEDDVDDFEPVAPISGGRGPRLPPPLPPTTFVPPPVVRRPPPVAPAAPIPDPTRPPVAPTAAPTVAITQPPTAVAPIAAPPIAVSTPPIEEPAAETPPPVTIPKPTPERTWAETPPPAREPIPEAQPQATPCDDCPGGKYERERADRRARELEQHEEAVKDNASDPPNENP